MFADDDSLSIRSVSSSRDEMMDSRSDERPKARVEPPVKLEGIAEGMRGGSATQYRNPRGLNGFTTVVDTPSGEEELLVPNTDWLNQFAVTVLKNRSPPAGPSTEIDRVRVRSPLLKAFLSEHLTAYPDYTNGKAVFPMNFHAPFEPLFHIWDTIVSLQEEHPDPATREHIKILHDALAKYFERPLKALEQCRSTGRITYPFLWTIFKPGQILYSKEQFRDMGKERLVKLETASHAIDGENAKCFLIDGHVMCWNGHRFGTAVLRENIYDTASVMNITELTFMPLDLHPDREAIRARNIKRGQKYVKTTRTELKAYTGPQGEANYAFAKETDEPLQVLDRIIVHPFNVGSTTTPRNLDPLVKENPFEKSLQEPSTDASSSSPGSLRRRREKKYVTDLRKAREEYEKTSCVVGNWSGKHYSFSEEQLLIVNPLIPIFDMTRQTWGNVGIDDFGEVAWNEDAYDDLAFPEDEKDLLLSVAKAQVDCSDGDFGAVLDKKSRGTTICLTGPPGVGKTMAVEALAERLHKPLYSVNILEMIRKNQDNKMVDNDLANAFERCRKWNAIMLIKHLDFLLEKALWKSARGEYAAMIAHYLLSQTGLIFITAKNLVNVDPFLQSHFDLTIEVPKLNATSRRKVWENAITQALPLRQRHFTSDHLDQLAETELSGKEIKSVVKMAQMAAKAKDEGLKMAHLETVLKIRARAQPKVDETSKSEEKFKTEKAGSENKLTVEMDAKVAE